jgi:polar amino acid transport system substrate-binding protein
MVGQQWLVRRSVPVLKIGVIVRRFNIVPLGLLLAVVTAGLVTFVQPFIASAQPPEEPRPLLVVTKTLEPLVYIRDNQPSGFSIDLWQELARRMNRPYQWVIVKTVTDQLNAVQQKQADAAIAGISLTPEREKTVDFSYPYFDAGLQIMTRKPETASFWSIASGVFSPDLVRVIAWLLLFLLAIAHLVWFFDRLTQQKHYSPNYFQGVGEAFWWAGVTLASGGYGDKTPESPLRRAMLLVWMFTGIVLISNFTAAITTQNTLQGLRSDIQGIGDLSGRQVAAVAGSTGAKFLTEEDLPFRGVQKIEEAYKLLKRKNVDAIVYDSPVLQYYASHAGKGQVMLVDELLKPEVYGIALPQGSPLQEEINRYLLEIKLDGTYQRLYDGWFGDTSADQTAQ